MKFSQRKGYTAVAKIIQKDGMSDELRNSLWNVVDIFVWESTDFLRSDYGRAAMDEFSTALWFHYFKKPMDVRPDSNRKILEIIRQYFFACEWYEVYDFLEWTLNNVEKEYLESSVNNVLKRELAGLRFVGGVFTDITDEQEIQSLDEALKDDSFPGVQAHLEAALRLLSDRKAPDYRNSIKESISAVESISQVIVKEKKATFAEALAVLEKRSALHPALKQGFTKLYGYTSDEGGIRHAMLEEPDLDASDAKFFLLSCTSFINYLKSKI